MTCHSRSCCLRHPRSTGELHSINRTRHPTDVRDVRLLISAPVAAYVPVWYVREAVNNWLRFTLPSTHAVLHMDRARDASFSDDDFTADWLWLRGGTLRERVLINPLRIFTRRRSGALLAAHVHNFLFAQRTVATSHVLFLAHNCFFIRAGIEAYVAARGATAAMRACTERPIKLNRNYCTTQPWFAPLNAHKKTGARSTIEGQFFPVGFVNELWRQLATRNVHGQPIGGGSNRNDTLLNALPRINCTAEESLLPAVVLRAPRSLLNETEPTEPVAWVPSSLTNGSIVGRTTIVSLLSTNTTLSLPKVSGCPQARAWGLQTKYLVKRVAMDEADASQVRRLIASLPGAEGM